MVMRVFLVGVRQLDDAMKPVGIEGPMKKLQAC
jgi:hypothetical protein